MRKIRNLLWGIVLSCIMLICPLPASAWAPVPGTVLQEYVHNTKYNHPCYAERLDNGNFLFCVVGYQDPAVVEVDNAGREVWRFDGVQPLCATRLGNGNTLIADSGAPGYPFTPRVLEVDSRGQIVWEYELDSPARSPRHVQRLSNGNTLITLPFKIIEVTPGKKVSWSYGADGPLKPGQPGFLANPVQAARLENGNTLVVDKGFGQGRVLEISPGKETVWQYGKLDASGEWPFGTAKQAEKKGDNAPGLEQTLAGPTAAKRLDDGTTLITDIASRRVLQISRDGKPVQEISWAPVMEPWPLWNSWYAAAMDNGSLLLTATLSSSNSRVLLLDIGDQAKM